MLHTEKIQPYFFDCEAVGIKAYKLLSNSNKGAKVHSIFDKAFYIVVGSDSLIKVITNNEYISSNSIVLKNSGDCSFRSIGIKEGMTMGFKDNELIFENNALVIRFVKPVTWKTPPVLKKKELLKDLIFIGLNLRVLRDIIYTCPSREGLVSLLEKVEFTDPLQYFLQPQEQIFPETVRPYIDLLMRGLYAGDFKMAVEGASFILGLGPGLTPSGDDFLAGLILSLNVGGNALLQKDNNDFNLFKKVSGEIYNLSKKKTTIYSQSLLNEALNRDGPNAAIQLIYSLLTKDVSEVARRSKILIKIGETSGADILIGIYYGIRFLVSKLERIEDFNEIA